MDSNPNSPICKTLITLHIPSRRQITCLAAHKSLLYAAASNQITAFDLSTFSPATTFAAGDPSSGSIKSMAFHNSKIFTAHQDGKIRVWRVSGSKPRLLSALPTVKDRLRRFITPGNYVTVRRHKKRLWIHHYDAVSGLALHGGVMYSASWDKSFKLWNVETNRCLESVTAHPDAVNAVAVAGNGAVFTGGADGLIRVWEKMGKEGTHKMVATLKKHKSAVNALAVNGDGSAVFSGCGDGEIVVWERKRDGEVAFVEALWGHEGAVLCLVNVGRWIVSGSSDRTVRIWEHGKKNGCGCRVIMRGHEKAVKSVVAVARSGCNKSESKEISDWLICSGSLDGEIRVWEICD